MPGTLFVVATPIGNLEDLTFRALRTLKEVDLIAAEDTRRTLKLLSHYGIRKPMVSLREHNERRESGRLVARLTAGESVALVSDAGTPAIADPGARLVAAAREAGIRISAIPGPSAVAAAVSISGLTEEEFTFMGFPPAGGPGRRAWLERLAAEHRPVVFFEAPHRLAKTLRELRSLEAERPILIHKELTKINEISVEQQSQNTSESSPDVDLTRGEYVLVVGASEDPENEPNLDARWERILTLLAGPGGFPRDEALDLTAKAIGSEAGVVKKADKKRRYSTK